MQDEEKAKIIDKSECIIKYLENHDTIDSKVKIEDYKNIIQEALRNSDNATFIQLLIKSNQLEKEIIKGEERYVAEEPESPVRQETAGQIAGAAAGQGNNSAISSNQTASESNRSSSSDRLSAVTPPKAPSTGPRVLAVTPFNATAPNASTPSPSTVPRVLAVTPVTVGQWGVSII